MMPNGRSGPLSGLRVIEFASIGPGPHCAMLLADMGAQVLRVDRHGGNGWPNAVTDRGRATKVVDIRHPEGRDWCRSTAKHADVVIEGFRPGVMERLGLGPDDLCAENPRLIYGRMTGWGQEGPWASTAGHDINYIALSGVLAAMGKPGEPAAVPLNLVGDFGGGSMFLAFGIVAALWERERSGRGQIVDAAIIDGVASLMTMFAGLVPAGRISLDRERNLLAGSAPFYRTYLCRDGREMSVGPLEPQFFSVLMATLGIAGWDNAQYDEARWGELTGLLAAAFVKQDMAYWAARFEGLDACVAPVLTLEEVPFHPHHMARQTYARRDSIWHAAPAPRFSRTPGGIADGGDGDAMADSWSSRAP